MCQCVGGGGSDVELCKVVVRLWVAGCFVVNIVLPPLIVVVVMLLHSVVAHQL